MKTRIYLLCLALLLGAAPSTSRAFNKGGRASFQFLKIGIGAHQTAVGEVAVATFRDGGFDVVVCIQNGISAFHVDRRLLIERAVRLARQGGQVLFSTYSERFWPDRQFGGSGLHRLGPGKSALLEPLGHHPQTRAIEIQNLDPVVAAVDEDE